MRQMTQNIGWAGIIVVTIGMLAVGLVAFTKGSVVRVAYDGYVREIERNTRRLFLKIGPGTVPLLQILGVVVGVVGGTFDEPKLLLLIPIAIFGPRLAFLRITKKRLAEIDEQTVPWLALLTNSLKVTGSLADAFKQTLDLTGGALGQELDLMLKEIKMGLPLPEAIRSMAERIGSEQFSTIATVIVIGRSTGGELPVILERSAATIRERMRLMGVLRKNTANSKMQLTFLLLSPVGAFFGFRAMDPKYFDPLLNGGILGYGIIAMVVMAWGTAAVVGRKILMVDM